MFQRILIPVDFSQASRIALDAGKRTAEKCHAEVFVIHVLTFLADMHHASKGVVPGVNWLSATRKELEEFVAYEQNQEFHLDVLADHHAYSEILNYAERHACELIVTGSHGHSGFVNSLLGSTTQKLMRLSKVPIMVVPERAESGRFEFQNILIPTDFSDASMKAIRLGIQIAQSWNSILHLIHVVDLKALSEMQKNSGHPLLRIDPSLDVTPTSTKILAQNAFTGDSRLATLFGDPNEEILKYAAEHKIDFIVMGSHGRKGLDRILIGSTTASVARQARIPIITVCGDITEHRR